MLLVDFSQKYCTLTGNKQEGTLIFEMYKNRRSNSHYHNAYVTEEYIIAVKPIYSETYQLVLALDRKDLEKTIVHTFLLLFTIIFKKIICYCKEPAGIAVSQTAVKPEYLKYRIEDTVVMAFQYFITGQPVYSEKLIDGALTNDFFQRLTKSFCSKDTLTALLKELNAINIAMIFNIRTAYKFYHMVLHCPLMESAFDTEEYLLYGYEQLVSEYKTFHEMLRCLLKLMDISGRELPDTNSRISSFMQIIKFLNENFQKEISLQQLAEYFHMNASYISFLIKKETGLTYSQYLTNLRITQAKKLLTSSQMTLMEISESVGFHDYFYFIKKFKKITGVTPGYYQKNLSAQWNT